MTFLQLKKIFKEKLQGKYVLFGNPDDPASTNTYWMRMNGIQGANIVGGHGKDDTAVARKLEMVMQKIQSKSFTVYNDEITVRKAAEKNQEKKALESEAADDIYDGTDVQKSPIAPALDEIDSHQENKERAAGSEDQEVDFEDFVVDDAQDQSMKNDTDGKIHKEIAVDDIFEGFDSDAQDNDEKDIEDDVKDHNQSEVEAVHTEDTKEGIGQEAKKSPHLMSGLHKRGVHVGEINPNFHATPPKYKKEQEEEKKAEEDREQQENDQRQQEKNARKREEEQKRQAERELVEQKERERSQHKAQKKEQKDQEKIENEEKKERKKSAEQAEQKERERIENEKRKEQNEVEEREEQERIENEERKKQQEIKETQNRQRQKENKRIEEEKGADELNENDDGVEDIFDSFTSDRGHSMIKPIERSEPPLEVRPVAKVRNVPTPQNIPVVPVPKLENSLHVEGGVVVGEMPLLEAIELFWKDSRHTKTTNTRDFIVDVEKFSDQYFAHFSDEKMRIMYGWQTLRESASESFHVSPTFSECESQFGPRALNQYIHSLPNR